METESSLVNIGPSKFIDGFTLMDARLETGIKMRFAIGGNGPALMLVMVILTLILSGEKLRRFWLKSTRLSSPICADTATRISLRAHQITAHTAKKRWLKTSSL